MAAKPPDHSRLAFAETHRARCRTEVLHRKKKHSSREGSQKAVESVSSSRRHRRIGLRRSRKRSQVGESEVRLFGRLAREENALRFAAQPTEASPDVVKRQVPRKARNEPKATWDTSGGAAGSNAPCGERPSASSRTYAARVHVVKKSMAEAGRTHLCVRPAGLLQRGTSRSFASSESPCFPH